MTEYDDDWQDQDEEEGECDRCKGTYGPEWTCHCGGRWGVDPNPENPFRGGCAPWEEP